MLELSVEHFGDIAVIECYGRIVRSDAAFRLRDAVIGEAESRIIVLDFRTFEIPSLFCRSALVQA